MQRYKVFLKESFKSFENGCEGFFYSEKQDLNNYSVGYDENVILFKTHMGYREKEVGIVLRLNHCEFNIEVKPFFDEKLYFYNCLKKLGFTLEEKEKFLIDENKTVWSVNGFTQENYYMTIEMLIDYYKEIIDDFISKNEKTIKITKKNYEDLNCEYSLIGGRCWTEDFCNEVMEQIDLINDKLHILNLHYEFEKDYFTY